MAVYGVVVMTLKGLALYAKAQSGVQLQFTRMQIGSGELPGGQDPTELTALIDPIGNFAINAISTSGSTSHVKGVFENSSLVSSTYACELGLFATDPDDGEILYAYANAGDQGDTIPPISAGPYSKQYQLNVAIGNASNVTAIIPEGVYASAQDLADLAEDVGDMSTVPTVAKDAAGAITELFTSVSDGKALVAAAITDKGVPTAADDTFAEMADNIDAIPVGPDTSDATAVPGDMRAGKTAYGAAGTKMTGTVPVQSGGNVVPGPSDIVKAAGIYDTPITVKGVVVDPNKVLTGTTIAGTAGAMPNRAGDTAAIASSVAGSTLKLLASQGYRDGVDDNVTITDADFIAANIRSGVNLFGLAGSLVEGKPLASGDTNKINQTLTVTGLAFQPKFIVAELWYAWPAEIYFYSDGVYFPAASKKFGAATSSSPVFTINASGFTITGLQNDAEPQSVRWMAIG